MRVTRRDSDPLYDPWYSKGRFRPQLPPLPLARSSPTFDDGPITCVLLGGRGRRLLEGRVLYGRAVLVPLCANKQVAVEGLLERVYVLVWGP